MCLSDEQEPVFLLYVLTLAFLIALLHVLYCNLVQSGGGRVELRHPSDTWGIPSCI